MLLFYFDFCLNFGILLRLTLPLIQTSLLLNIDQCYVLIQRGYQFSTGVRQNKRNTNIHYQLTIYTVDANLAECICFSLI